MIIRLCRPIPKNPQQKLTPITSPWPFYKFGLPGEIISDNGKQFRDNPFKDWCEKLNIKQRKGDTPFSLTYGTEAVIPVEIWMPSLRCAKRSARPEANPRWKSIITLRSAAQPSVQQTSSTAAMKQATPKKRKARSKRGRTIQSGRSTWKRSIQA
ncbi:reverse transcriptase domain-containing protein [Tanacetum coccineum]